MWLFYWLTACNLAKSKTVNCLCFPIILCFPNFASLIVNKNN